MYKVAILIIAKFINNGGILGATQVANRGKEILRSFIGSIIKDIHCIIQILINNLSVYFRSPN